jgi:GT2 family glycosyltransferase
MTSAAPLVSVVIATHNRRRLLAEAVATVFEQTFPDWELIVVDDASSDDTPAYLASFDDARVRAIRLPEHGERSVARNRGLHEARGEFVMFLDDDDLLRPGALAMLSDALRADPAAVAATAPCRVMQERGDSFKVYWPAGAQRRVIWRELLFGFWANSGQNLYRAAVVRELGGFDPELAVCEDRKLWLQLARRGPVLLLPSVAMTYRLHDGQAKPPDIDAVRRRVWKEFMDALPPRERAQGLRTRRAAELVATAAQARVERRFAAALLTQARAVLAAPWLLVSPLTARPLWWGIKKCVQGSEQP